LEWTRDQKSDALGVAEADPFGHKFPEDNVKSGEQDVGKGDGDAVGDQDGVRSRHPGEERLDRLREREFSKKTQSDGRQGDSHLYTGDHTLEVRNEILDNARVGIATLYKLAHAGEAHGDERKLRRGKKRIDADQRQDAEQAYEEHRAILSASDAGH
jgi:hypothetical protein